MDKPYPDTASHSFLEVFAANGVDRAFLVPGESYLGILDALNDFPAITVVTCRHEAGAGLMACADARLTGRPALVMVSRGPGASNAAIALHSAQQDAVPLVLVVGQVPKAHLRRESFQEIDYQRMYDSIAKWVYEATDPDQLAEAAFKALRLATGGTPGPVVLVVPEDIQQQRVALRPWRLHPPEPTQPSPAALQELIGMLESAKRPMVVAGSGFESERGRPALLAFAERWQIPVAVSFRRHDVLSNNHPLFVGDLGLANDKEQMDAFQSSDLLLLLGTRMGDVTSQGYTFPRMPSPAQTVVHCHPDSRVLGLNFASRMGLVCDPVTLVTALTEVPARPAKAPWSAWTERLQSLRARISRWPASQTRADGVAFREVVRALSQRAPPETIVCLDAGTFAAPVYRHFRFNPPQRLLAPISGGMGYGTPAAIAAQMRRPDAKVVCLVGDGGFMMTGNEMIAAAERQLPILFIVADNGCFASIRIHQDAHYPGRHVGTTLTNPDFAALALAFGVQSETITSAEQIEPALSRGLASKAPYLLHVRSSLAADVPASQSDRSRED